MKNILKYTELFKIAQLLLAKKDELSKDGTSNRNVAIEFGKELDFKVTEANIKSACKMCGVQWKRKETNPEGGRKLNILKILVLAHSVERLYGKLGEPLPPAFLDTFHKNKEK